MVCLKKNILGTSKFETTDQWSPTGTGCLDTLEKYIMFTKEIGIHQMSPIYMDLYTPVHLQQNVWKSPFLSYFHSVLHSTIATV